MRATDFSLSTLVSRVTEHENAAITFSISRSTSTGTDTVYFSALNGEDTEFFEGATNDGDFTGRERVAMTFAEGQDTIYNTILVFNDELNEGIEYFRAVIEDSDGVILDENIFSISDRPSLSFGSDHTMTPEGQLYVRESAESFEFTIRQKSATANDVYFVLSPLYDATYDDFYMRELVLFPDGPEQSVTVNIPNDQSSILTKGFMAGLSYPGSSLLFSATHVTIIDDDIGVDTIPANPSTTSTLAAGNILTEEIHQRDIGGRYFDTDYYRVTLQGGTEYRFTGTADVSLTDGLDAIAMRLYWNDTVSASRLFEGTNPDFTFSAPGSGPVTYYLAVSAGGDGDWTNKTGLYQLGLEEVGVATLVNHRPVAEANDAEGAAGSSIPLVNLFSFFDPDGNDGISSFAVLDRTPGSGYLTFDGIRQDDNTLFERPIEELPRWSFVVGDDTDRIGFNVIDQAGAFNDSVVATVLPLAEAEQLKAAQELFDDVGGKLTTLALFSNAAYDKNYNTVSELEQLGWSILTPNTGLSESAEGFFSGNYFVNGSPFNLISGVASALLAESQDGQALVLAFRGTDDTSDWVNNFAAISSHYELFQPLLASIDFSKYSEVYITGHSLGAAMAQRLLLDESLGLRSNPNVETVAFANPGYTVSPLGAFQSRIVNVAIKGDPVAEIGIGVRTVGDTYKLDHTLPASLDWHKMEWYLAAARYLDETAASSGIDWRQSNNIRDRFDIKVRMEVRDGQEWIGHLPKGSVISPDEVVAGTVFALDSPSDQWAVSLDTTTSDSTPTVIFDAPQFQNTSFDMSATPAGELLIRDAAGVSLFLTWEITSFLFRAAVPGSSLKVAKLALTHILNNTVYFDGDVGNDLLDGTEADRRLVAEGGLGNDTLIGGLGDDDLNGGSGNDTIAGAIGSDLLDGGDGDDNIAAGDGDDLINGGIGNDSIGGGFGNDTIFGGEGDDIMGAGFGDDSVSGDLGHDVVAGGAGNDTLEGGDGNDSMSGSFGNDLIDAGSGADDIGGGTGRDTIDAGTGNDRVGGGEGNDSILGDAGNDFLAGGGRNDTIDGGTGNDTINGGAGNDVMTGGADADQFVFSAFFDGESDVITDFEDGLDSFFIRRVDPDTGVENINNGGNGLAGFVAAMNIVDTAAGAQMSVNGNTILVEGITAAQLTVDDFQFL